VVVVSLGVKPLAVRANEETLKFPIVVVYLVFAEILLYIVEGSFVLLLISAVPEIITEPF
jgi:hypothetical protein